MRIISDFHDYYDIGMHNGIDPQLPYRRFRREEDSSLDLLHVFADFHGQPSIYYNCRSLNDIFSEWDADTCTLLFIGFAGKIYPALEYVNESNEKVRDFDIDKITPKFLRKQSPEEKKKSLDYVRDDCERMFALKDDQNLLNLFEQFETAIFVIRSDKVRCVNATIIINERLNVYNFQKVLPPMQAFQELAMYVGAYLTKPVIEEPPLSDKVKAEIHGFDKFSFRKEKKQRRKR